MENFKGYKRCPAWLREKYISTVKNICMLCHQHEDNVGTLKIHRKKRGWEGGLYTVGRLNDPMNNCFIVCKSCHVKLHANEFNNCRSK